MTWQLASLALLGLALAAGFAFYERSHPSARVLALVGTLAALAALGRIAFAPVPNLKPTTDIVLISGLALGGAPGFAVGALAALTSNMFFGQGPWTPWQMAAWGGVGLGAAALGRIARRPLGRVGLAVAGAVAGLAYGAVLDVFQWVTFAGEHDLRELAAYATSSLPWDLVHAGGNVVFALAFGPALLGALSRFRTRFDIAWLPAGAPRPAAGAPPPSRHGDGSGGGQPPIAPNL